MKSINFYVLMLAVGMVLAFCFKSENQTKVNYSQNDPFEKEWRTIDSLQGQGLPASALEELHKLLSKVRTANDIDQLIRCHLYEAKFTEQLDEKGAKKGILHLEAELEKTEGLEQAVLYSVLAQVYISYFNNNRWVIDQRTDLEIPGDDLETWSSSLFIQKSKNYYLKSLQEGDWLKLPISELEFILNKGQNTEDLRPTVFDFLAHRAVDHFSNTGNLITEPTNVFLLNHEKALGSTKEFLNIEFKAADENSGVFQAMLIIQNLVKHHQSLNNTNALLDIERKRLNFVRAHSVLSQKDQLYVDAIQSFLEKYKNNQNIGDFKYELANYYFQKANQFSSDPESRDADAYLNAKSIAKACQNEYPKSWGAEQCKGIIYQIEQKNLRISVEEANPFKQDFLVGLSFRNIKNFHVTLYNFDDALKTRLKNLNPREESRVLNQQPKLKSWPIVLDYKQDHYQHQTEFPVDGLEYGDYLIVVSESEKLSDQEHYQKSDFSITNLSLVALNNRVLNQSYLVIDRKIGDPISGVVVEQWTQKRFNRNAKDVKMGERISDDNGLVQFSLPKGNSYTFRLRKGEDHFHPDNRFYGQDPYRNNSSESVSFFLDRKIYRPGQTIYFKGIALATNKDRKPSILANKKYEVTFYDANQQKIETQSLVTNQFGSFQGTFVAPGAGLLGNFSIRTDNGGYINFSIEEYKRPKFKVEIDEPEKETSLNELVQISGSAQAYAGYPIDLAKVSYRVTRQAFFPWCGWWRIPPYYNRAQAEIANGIVQTNDKGVFEIEFKALPDLTIREEDRPEYNFMISVDVTDASGETHSASYSVKAGTVGFNLSHDIPKVVKATDFNQFTINSRNLNEQFISIAVEAQLQKLKKPQEFIKERYYTQPDIALLSEMDFKKQFALYAYGDEAKSHTWQVAEEVWKESWTTKENEQKSIGKRKLLPGSYKLILKGTDKFGKVAELETIFDVYSENSAVLPGTNLLWLPAEEKSFKPGESFSLPLFAKSKAQVYFQFNRNNELLKEGWKNVNLKNEISRSITQKDKGNCFLNILYVKENRFFQEQRTILVPWSDKKLKIETSTFRNNLKPGEEETWSFKISGEEKDQVAAEVLATMYDASLDAFRVNNFGLNPWPQNYGWQRITAAGFGSRNGRGSYPRRPQPSYEINRSYPGLNFFGYYPASMQFGNVRMESAMAGGIRPMAKNMTRDRDMAAPPEMDMADGMVADTEGLEENSIVDESTKESEAPKKEPVRTNLDETVFFFPQLKTDPDGNLTFSFKMNEALTSWKLLMQAHDENLRTGTLTKEIVTQKELMVVPNPPRFFREGDKVEFTSKVVNLTDEKMTGEVKLTLANALTEESISHLIKDELSKTFSLDAKASQSFSWLIEVPKSYLPAISHKVVANAGSFSDGEKEDRPVLTNRLLVTETFPMPVRAKESKKFDFKRIAEVQNSSTATPHQYSIEFTSNPAWYAVLALPYLMEYPHDCSEQIFSRYYANSIASGIANKYPKIQAVFKKWENTETLLSNLDKNQDLKSALLEETPWVLQAQSEAQQRKNIGLLFNLDKMGREQRNAINSLSAKQESGGGFPWFKGGRPNVYITEYILTGFKRLEKMGFSEDSHAGKVQQILAHGLNFVDSEFAFEFEELKNRLKRNDEKLDPEKNYLGSRQIHYLYTRSFFDQDLPSQVQEAYDFYQKQIEKFWTSAGLQNQAQIALILDRSNRHELAMNILKSFRERALHNEELGMYWRMNPGYFWYNNSLETHAFMISCLQEIDPQQRELEDLQTWLLKNKQTNAWETTKSTALAIYALLMTGEKPGASLANSELVAINIGGKELAIDHAEAGTGYFRTNYDSEEIPQNAGKVEVKNPNDLIAWGASYFQYFEDMDKVTHFEETPLQIKKEVFLQEITALGPVLKSLEKIALQPGDKLIVRVEVRVDREMEFVHLKDHRASGLEPENVLSGYRWKGSFGYYESTRDASTNFFISYLPKGTHVFEYPLRVVHKGDFSNGITTMQSMYAPEFSSHSKGIRIKVGDN